MDSTLSRSRPPPPPTPPAFPWIDSLGILSRDFFTYSTVRPRRYRVAWGALPTGPRSTRSPYHIINSTMANHRPTKKPTSESLCIQSQRASPSLGTSLYAGPIVRGCIAEKSTSKPVPFACRFLSTRACGKRPAVVCLRMPFQNSRLMGVESTPF